MYPRVFQLATLLFISVSLVSSSPAPMPAPQPIDATIANVIATNENLGCSGPSGCLAAQNTTAAAEIYRDAASSGATPFAADVANTLITAAAVAGGITIACLL